MVSREEILQEIEEGRKQESLVGYLNNFHGHLPNGFYRRNFLKFEMMQNIRGKNEKNSEKAKSVTNE